MKFRNITKAALALISISLITGCFDPESRSVALYNKSEKKLAQGDTAAAITLLKESFELNESNTNSLVLYSELLYKQNSARWEQSNSVDENELAKILDKLSMSYDESAQGTRKKIAQLMVEANKKSLTGEAAMEAVFGYYALASSEDNYTWQVASALYELIGDPSRIGVESAAELKLFADLVYSQVGSYSVIANPNTTIQQRMIDMVLMKFKSQVLEGLEKPNNFEDVKAGFGKYINELKVYDEKAREMDSPLRLTGSRHNSEMEYLNAVFKKEFESFLAANTDSLPDFKAALAEAEDKDDLYRIYSLM